MQTRRYVVYILAPVRFDYVSKKKLLVATT